MATLTFRRVENPEDAGVLRLTDMADLYLKDLYPPESNHSETLRELLASGSAFFAGEFDTAVVACGAIKLCDDDDRYGEFKSVFVDPAYRGKRLATRLMTHLEQFVKQADVELVRLETGPVQPEAISLYESLGYRVRGPYGSYQLDPLSVFMEKSLKIA